jgi:hypothetical protein
MLTGMASGDLDVSALLVLLVHELRTPANVVGGYLKLLQDPRAGALSEHQARLLAHAVRSWDQLVAMLADASALARLQRGEGPRLKQDFTPATLASAAAAAFVAPDPGTATLMISAAEPATPAEHAPVPSLRGDAQALAHAIAACARTLVHAGPPALRLVLSPAASGGAGHVAFLLAPEQALPEARSASVVWQPADRLRGGLGLELLLATAAIEADGGWVEQAAPGQGLTALRVVLPVTSGP